MTERRPLLWHLGLPFVSFLPMSWLLPKVGYDIISLFEVYERSGDIGVALFIWFCIIVTCEYVIYEGRRYSRLTIEAHENALKKAHEDKTNIVHEDHTT